MSHRLLLFACCLPLGACSPGPTSFGSDASATLDLAAVEGGAGCSPGCHAPTPICQGNRCVACAADADCPVGQQCKTVGASPACLPGCTTDGHCGPGRACCANRCVDPMTDPANCGGCGTICSGAHSSATCAGGACKPGTCSSGWGDCDGDPKNGCEANLHVDPMNCTACGAKCAIKSAVSACADGCYEAACQFGFDECNGDPMDGCETAVLSDVANCGGCGNSCGNLPNAKAACQSANCVLGSCSVGFADCDKLAMNGCEVNLATDGKNCGGCGTICPPGEVCISGGCNCPNCMNAFPNASATCQNGQCIFSKCNLGYANCDGNLANGCEVNINSDAKNCAGCGTVCPQNNPFCINGVCGQSAGPCSMVAAAFCAQKGWKIPNDGAKKNGAIVCTSDGRGAANDCDTCMTYNEVVWKDGAAGFFCGNPVLKAGSYYSGHNPCSCNGDPQPCGMWDMKGCMPD